MSKYLHSIIGSVLAAVPLGMTQVGEGTAQDLQSFAVISGQSLTNTGSTTISGNIAVSPGTSYTGSGSVTQTGETYLGDAVAGRIQDDLTTLYGVLAGRPTSTGGNLTGQDLGGLTLPAGVYNFDTSAGLAAGQTLTLDGGGNPDAIFIINVGSTLTAGSGSKVVLQNGAQGGNVFYRVGSSATLDTSADLVGQIVALTSITMNTTAAVGCGAAFARNGSITLDTNTIQNCTLASKGFEVPGDTPDTETPDPETPVVDNPDTDTPDVDEPDTDTPVVDAPDAETPDVETPDAEIPDVESPDAETPVVNNPGETTSFTENARDVAKALTDHVADGGVLPIGIAILPAAQTPEELAVSVNQLAGEVSTGVSPMVEQSMEAFLDVVTGRGRDRRPQVEPMGARDVGVSPGMVREKINTPYVGKYGSEETDAREEPLANTMMVTGHSSPWNVWATAYGSRNVTDGDASLGLQERTSENRGLAAGVDFAPTAYTDLGVAVSWNTADFALGNGFGTGSSDTAFMALRARTSTERAYVEGALAYGHSDIATERTLAIAGMDHLVGETRADNVAAHIEAGYKMGIFTPFAGLRGQSFTTKAYSETAEAGTSSYALRYDEHKTNSLRSELGVDMQWTTENVGGGAMTVGLRAAWAHEFASNEEASRSFMAIPGVAFPASGATQDRDSLILAANVGTSASNGLFADGAISGEYSDNSHDLGGSVTVGYRW